MNGGQIKRVNRVAGSIFDVAHLLALPDDDCNVIFCSSRTLYLMQQFAGGEVNWLTRYAESYTSDGEYYLPVVEESGNAEAIYNVARNYRLEVAVTSCFEIATALQSLTQAIRAINCGCDVGEGADNGETSQASDPPGPVGSIEYGAPSNFTSRRCKTANWIFDNLLSAVNELDANGIDTIVSATLAALTGLVSGMVLGSVAAGFGAIFGAVAGLFVGLVSQVLVGGVSFGSISTALTNNQEDLVCALYSGFDTGEAKSAFLAVLDSAGLSAQNQLVVSLMLPNGILNVLNWGVGTPTELEIQGWTSTVDCLSCSGLCGWSFLTAGGGPAGSGDLSKDNSTRTLTAIEGTDNIWRVQIQLASTGDCANRNAGVEIVSVSGSPAFNTAVFSCRKIGGGTDTVWQTQPDNPPLNITYYGYEMRLNSPTSFSVDVILREGVAPLCEPCPVNFVMYDGGSYPLLGEGSLVRSGEERTLTSVVAPNGSHYIMAKVGPVNTETYFADCATLPSACQTSPQHRFSIEFTGLTGSITSTAATYCTGTSRTVEWNQASLPSGAHDVSWFEIISDDPFSVTTIIGDSLT